MLEKRPLCVYDSFKGTGREENKDRVWVAERNEGLIVVLFDGISSAKEANRGIDIAVDFLEKNHGRFFSETEFSIADLMYGANSQIIRSRLVSPFTTYCAAFFQFSSKITQFSSLGDSRIYEITHQYLKQLTQDDNIGQNKNIVTKYLGMSDLERQQVPGFLRDTRGKRILLCSDGFYSILEKNLGRFYEILNFKSEASLKKSLNSEIRGNNVDDASYALIIT